MRTWSVYEQNQLRKYGISEDDLDKYGEMPVEYITGHAEFDGLDFLVNPAVLIPRIETVQILDEAMKLITDKNEINFAEIGTGSGAIGICLNKRLKDKAMPADRQGKRIKGILTDVSEDAIEVARENYLKLFPGDKSLEIYLSDLMNSIPDEMKFGLIIANLPYIPTSRLGSLPESVKDFEPHLALDGGEDGTSLIKKLIDQAKNRLVDGGTLVLEIDFSHDIADFVDSHDFDLQIRQDEFGQNRFLILKRRKKV